MSTLPKKLRMDLVKVPGATYRMNYIPPRYADTALETWVYRNVVVAADIQLDGLVGPIHSYLGDL